MSRSIRDLHRDQRTGVRCHRARALLGRHHAENAEDCPMNLVELQRALRELRMMGRSLSSLLVVTLMPIMAITDVPIAASSFYGAEGPLSDNGAWAELTSLSSPRGRFHKSGGRVSAV